MNTDFPYHMNATEFKRYGYEIIDWIADYYQKVEQYPVKARVKPGEIKAVLPDNPPQKPESMADILKDLNEKIMPGVTHWQHPHFFGYFPANTSGPSLLADMISGGLGVLGFLWETCPACTELEIQVLDWLAKMLQLPKDFLSSGTGGAVIQDTASSATLCAMLAAREWKNKGESNLSGVAGNLVAYVSSQAHSSLEKAAMIAGIGANNVREIAVLADFSMDVEDLERQINLDIQAGKQPFFVCATLGTTSSQAIDPLLAIGSLCKQFDLWCHVDAAMGGVAAICEEFQYMHQGIDQADSYVVNPHKWLLVNMDCSCLFIKNRNCLINALNIMPDYLKNKTSEASQAIDYYHWQVPLGRRFRSLKLWSVLRYYGIEGLQAYLRNHIQLTQQFLAYLESDDKFEIVAPVPMNLICFRVKGSDAINQRLLEWLNDSGEMLLTHTRLKDRFVLRFCVGQSYTEARHIEKAWHSLKKAVHQCC